jgi:large subunit ribosomal protein L24
VIEREAALQISNVAVVCPACGQPTRIGYRMTEDHKVRVCRKCGKDVDR